MKLDEHRKAREPSRAVLERRRSEEIVGSHLPALADLQSLVARLTAQAGHSVRVGGRADRQLRDADDALRRIREARQALTRAGNQGDGRVEDVEKSLMSLYQRTVRVKALIEQQSKPAQ